MSVNPNGNVDVVLGIQWGDEGKAKIVDYLCENGEYNIVARFNGGSNAGHTVVHNGQEFKFHLVPSGILYPNIICYLGNGVMVNIEKLVEELRDMKVAGLDFTNRFYISDKAHVVQQRHIQKDIEQSARLGTTKQGMGPCAEDKYGRRGVRFEDLDWARQCSLYPDVLSMDMVVPLTWFHNQLESGKRVLAEGANATMLDIEFGSYPYVTSSHTTIGGVLNGLGIPPQCLRRIYGVVKAYTTRVGEGPFEELTDDCGRLLQELGHEFGATTGRMRRCGWLDMRQVTYAMKLNGVTHIAITKADVIEELTRRQYPVSVILGEAIHERVVLKSYKEFLEILQGLFQDKLSIFSYGPERSQTVVLNGQSLVEWHSQQCSPTV